jgi:DNA-binding LacI/PurR family transcriptional regulator
MRSKTIDPRDSLFYYRTLQGMHQEGALGASIAVRTLYAGRESELAAQLAQDAALSGIVVVGLTDQALLKLLLETGKPVAFFDCAYPAAPGTFDFVSHASEDGGFQAVSALLELGHREIGFLVHGSSNDPSDAAFGEIARERLAGFERAYTSRALPLPAHRVIPAVPCGSYAYEAVRARFQRADLPRLTALACTTDDIALGAVAAVREAGFKIPEDVSVVGFGDLGLFSAPALSTVAMQLEESGAEAVRLLRERILQPGQPIRRKIFPVTYIARGTTAALHEK